MASLFQQTLRHGLSGKNMGPVKGGQTGRKQAKHMNQSCITTGGLKNCTQSYNYEVCHEKTDLKVFVVVKPKEGWARVATPILLLV